MLEATRTLVDAFVISQVDYCSSMFAGVNNELSCLDYK